MSPAEALAAVRQTAKDGSIRIAIADPDQALWCLGAVGGLEALVELLQSATSAQSVAGGGFRVTAPGVLVLVDDELVVIGVAL